MPAGSIQTRCTCTCPRRPSEDRGGRIAEPLAGPDRTQPRHRTRGRHRRQRFPAGDGPGLCPGLLVVGDAGEPPAQLDSLPLRRRGQPTTRHPARRRHGSRRHLPRRPQTSHQHGDAGQGRQAEERRRSAACRPDRSKIGVMRRRCRSRYRSELWEDRDGRVGRLAGGFWLLARRKAAGALRPPPWCLTRRRRSGRRRTGGTCWRWGRRAARRASTRRR